MPDPIMEAVIIGDGAMWPWSINAERSVHWSKRATWSKQWRRLAGVQGKAAIIEAQKNLGLSRSAHLPRCHVTATIPLKGARRRDPSNWLPAVKAVIDGLVDAGWWPDDNSDWVTLAEPVIVLAESTTPEIRISCIPQPKETHA